MENERLALQKREAEKLQEERLERVRLEKERMEKQFQQKELVEKRTKELVPKKAATETIELGFKDNMVQLQSVKLKREKTLRKQAEMHSFSGVGMLKVETNLRKVDLNLLNWLSKKRFIKWMIVLQKELLS